MRNNSDNESSGFRFQGRPKRPRAVRGRGTFPGVGRKKTDAAQDQVFTPTDAPADVMPDDATSTALNHDLLPTQTMALPRRKGTSGTMKILMAGVVLLVAIGAAMMVMEERDRMNGSSSTGEKSWTGGVDRTYGYYHDRYFDGQPGGTRWRDSSAGTEDDVIDRYDGPYDYSGYAEAPNKRGHRSNQSADSKRGSADPLANSSIADDDVFDDLTGDTSIDPTFGDPIGDPQLAWFDPTYNPWAGYSNPYANRIRMAWGPGWQNGAYEDQP